MHRFEEAIAGTIDNFPVAPVRWLMRLCVFPLGRAWRPASDRLGHEVVRLACEPGEVRDRLTRYIYVSKDVRDPTGLLEVTLEKVIAAEPAERKLERAIRDGVVRRYHGIDWIGDAAAKGVLTARGGDAAARGRGPDRARHRGRSLRSGRGQAELRQPRATTRAPAGPRPCG